MSSNAGGTGPPRPRTVKCLVWDLDNTLWRGTLLENDDVEPFPEAVAALKALDERGILHSIASRNDHDAAMAKLTEFGLAEYFLAPRIGWEPKSASVKGIAADLNIGIDSLAFLDDQPFEREEVAFALPEVACFDARQVADLAGMDAFIPRFVTDDSRARRQMYRADQERKVAEADFTGVQEAFLESLRMRFSILPAAEDDLQRAEELTLRTNQLNTTGYTYSYAELDAFRTSDDHLLLASTLEDRYGPYGTIGLTLVEKGEREWVIKLLLMSCRVMARGVGTIVINHLKRSAAAAGVRLLAEFVPTDRNRMMFVSYKFNRFSELSRRDGVVLLEADLSAIPADPAYVAVTVSAGPDPATAISGTPDSDSPEEKDR
ncbi:HAD-IIIC family phosphatase [Actinoplanes sp. NPDC049118]|uniref:HAD-IIIC family phosphatase n=1 Tax=Actinoplanes sp. NPDC049118 TaxID=3155769 RepID=UPI0034042B74